MKKYILSFVFAFITVCCLAQASKYGKVNLSHITDRVQENIKDFTGTVVVEKYDFTEKFGEPKVGGKKESRTFTLDKHGFYTMNDGNIYENEYLTDGRISVVKILDSTTKVLQQMIKFQYALTGEENAGVLRIEYDKSGDRGMVTHWLENVKHKHSPKYGEVYQKLNAAGQPIHEEIDFMNIESATQYNSYNVPTAEAIDGFGGVVMEYKYYKYDSKGNWTERFVYKNGSPDRFEKRIFMTQEEMEAEQERARQEELERNRIAEQKRIEAFQLRQSLMENFLSAIDEYNTQTINNKIEPTSIYISGATRTPIKSSISNVIDILQKEIIPSALNNKYVTAKYGSCAKVRG
ncbi:MAG: hypothetical protein LIP03_07455 [Bacteroidales bacterium]|nr:hypothetical protein [Bacteroidales bacterium]